VKLFAKSPTQMRREAEARGKPKRRLPKPGPVGDRDAPGRGGAPELRSRRSHAGQGVYANLRNL